MSNVKLVTPRTRALAITLAKFRADGVPIRVIDATKITRAALLARVFGAYRGKVIILGPYKHGSLPVPDYTYITSAELRGWSADRLRHFICDNTSTRTHTRDNKKFYDIHKLWWLAEQLSRVRVRVDTFAKKHFCCENVKNAVSPWDYMTPISVIMNPSNHHPERERILCADLSFPILIYSHNGIIDGNHRLMKAWLLKRRTIPAIIIGARELARARIRDDIKKYDDKF